MKYIKKFSKESDRERYIKNNFVSPHCFMNSQNKSLHTLKTYQRVEYLENNTFEYINTYIYATNSTHTIIKGQYVKSIYNNFGCGTLEDNGGAKNRYQVMCKSNNYFHFGIGTNYLNARISDTDIHIFELYGNGIAKIDNETYDIGNSTISQSINPIYLFALNNTNIQQGSYIRIYSCKIYENNDIILNMIPIRIGTVGYMFDTVSNTLFGNNGTGNFILGPDI